MLSVVVPVYRCVGCLDELYRRLCTTLESMGQEFELLFVEDRGEDGSWEKLCELSGSDPRVRAFRLSRNFGQHAAITAGLSKATGRWIVVMDCDLQDPPEEIPRLYARAMEGYEIVLARRLRTGGTPWPRRVLSRLYFTAVRLLTGANINGEYGSFSLISATVADAFMRFRDHNRHYVLILYWLGFDRTSIEYSLARRGEGRSSYSVGRLLRHAVEGVFFTTTVLLRWVVYFGFVVSLCGAGSAVYLVAARATGHAYPGWTSLFVLVVVLGGVIIVSVGVIGLYVGQVFDEARDRPLFLIDKESSIAERREDAGLESGARSS
jgi:polyisoprenyl-phosphate glycosyltransferase